MTHVRATPVAKSAGAKPPVSRRMEYRSGFELTQDSASRGQDRNEDNNSNNAQHNFPDPQ